MTAKFIWSDLSTFDLKKAKRFYKNCFDWSYSSSYKNYTLCTVNQQAAAGLYTMPEKFQKINMPSFWMSYIQVENIDKTVRLAEEHGAKIEVPPEPAPGGGRVALIRDPSGAGFTCYEGSDLGEQGEPGGLGKKVWHELHVSDLSKIQSFYESVFEWHIQPASHANRYEIFDTSNELIAGIQVSSNAIKGDKEYWGVYFSVACLKSTSLRIQKAGGEILAKQPLGAKPALLVKDSQGAAFYIVESGNTTPRSNDKQPKSIKWRAITGLLLVLTAILYNANWIWGVFFLLWLIPDIKNGSTHFLEHIERKKNPIVYWCIIITWLTLSLYWLVDWASPS